MGRLVFIFLFFFVNRFVCFVQCFTIIIIKCKASFSCHSSHKQSLGQGNIFTAVCHSVHRGVLSQHALQVVSSMPYRGVLSQHALHGRCAIPACIACGIPASHYSTHGFVLISFHFIFSFLKK